MNDERVAWAGKVSPQFRIEVINVCGRLGWDLSMASNLMAVMAFESAQTFSASVRNPWSTAVGLIQFMEGTARGLGTTTKALARMSEVEQLRYVERYFKPNAGRIKTLEDLYMAVLWPRGIGQPLEYLLWKTGTRAYLVNRGLDRNRDGLITKAEAVARVRAELVRGLLPENAG